MQNKLKELQQLKGKFHNWDMMLVVGSSIGSIFPGAIASLFPMLLFPTEGPNFFTVGVFIAVTVAFAVGNFRISSRKRAGYDKQIERVKEEIKLSYGLPQGINLENIFYFGGNSSVILHRVGTRTDAYTLVNSGETIRLYDPQGKEIIPSKGPAEPKEAAPEPVVYAENEQLWQTAAGGK